MAASKFQIRVPWLVHYIATKFQVLYQCFGGPAIQWNLWYHSMIEPKETGNGKSKMAASKLQIRVTWLVQQMATKFQVLNPQRTV